MYLPDTEPTDQGQHMSWHWKKAESFQTSGDYIGSCNHYDYDYFQFRDYNYDYDYLVRK